MASYIETPEYAKAVRRQLKAYCDRIEKADEVDLAEAVKVLNEFEEMLSKAATAMAARTSWSYVADGLGMTRQGARQKFMARRFEKSLRNQRETD